MSGIDATAAIEWPGQYASPFAGATCSIPALGWQMSLPVSSIVNERLKNPGFFPLRWVAHGIGSEDRRLRRRLFQMGRRGEIALVDDERIVAVPASLAPEWEPTKAAVLRLIGPQPTAYTAIRARARLPEASIQTALQVLSDDRAIVVDTPGNAENWELMSFRKAATAAS